MISFSHIPIQRRKSIMRTYKKVLLVPVVFVLLAFVGFGYYLKWTPFYQHSGVIVEAAKTKRYVREVRSEYAAQSEVGIENIVRATSKKKLVSRVTTQSSLDVEAEKDSKKRMKSMDSVCKKPNAAISLEPSLTDRKSKKLEQQTVLRHLIVSEKHKVMFCFIPKASSTNIRRIFVAFGGSWPSVDKIRGPLDVHLMRMNNETFTEEKRQYMLAHFYKFMIVRDPFERLASAFLHKFRRMNFEIFSKVKQKIIAGRNVTFTDYALHLVNNHPWTLDMHFMPYEYLCKPCDVKYDFIGSTDSLSRDVTHVMRQIHADENKFYVKAKKVRTEQTTAELLKELSKENFDKLLAVYKRDHELFGYPLPTYETLDKRYPA